MRLAAVICILILAACADDGETATTTVAPPEMTTLGTAAAPTTVAPTTTAAPTTTTTTTTTTAPPNGEPAFGLTQVVFGDGSFVVITNWGDGTGNLEGYWLCQGQLYKSLPAIELGPGEQALLGVSKTPPPELAGMAANLFLGPTIGELDPRAGEVALFSSNAFDDPDAIISYVEWGEPGQSRSAIAIEAGIWSEGAVVVFDDAPSISSGVFPATSSDSWFADIGG